MTHGFSVRSTREFPLVRARLALAMGFPIPIARCGSPYAQMVPPGGFEPPAYGV